MPLVLAFLLSVKNRMLRALMTEGIKAKISSTNPQIIRKINLLAIQTSQIDDCVSRLTICINNWSGWSKSAKDLKIANRKYPRETRQFPFNSSIYGRNK